MFGLDLRSPQRLATSSGSVSLNSPFVPSHVMDANIFIGSIDSAQIRMNREKMKEKENKNVNNLSEIDFNLVFMRKKKGKQIVITTTNDSKFRKLVEK